MYAIIRTGGKQMKVSEGDVLDVERLKGVGDEVSFTPLLIVQDDGSTITGREHLAEVKVRAKVLGETLGPKIDIFKYKAKTGYRRRAGHRQRYTTIEITGIDLPEKKTTKKKAAVDEKAAASEET
jgi:large subunit ribosomal protein L21